MIRYSKYDLELIDGTTHRVEPVSREQVADGVLSLFERQNEYDDEIHLGSWPLTVVRTWRRSRWP